MEARCSDMIPGYEDNYGANEFEDFPALLEAFESLCEDPLYGRWNVPVWIDTDDETEFTHGPRLVLGLMLTRHGECVQWVVEFGEFEEGPTIEEALAELRQRVLRVWAGRAEQGFARSPMGGLNVDH